MSESRISTGSGSGSGTSIGTSARTASSTGMPQQPEASAVLTIQRERWDTGAAQADAIAAVESGRVLYFPHLAFALAPHEQALLTPAVRDPKVRNISLDGEQVLKGARGDAETLAALAGMIGRFRTQSRQLIDSLLPQYSSKLRMAPTSFRPSKVESRAQSWRADDRRLHLDAFPSRPNHGERILRVFANVNPDGVPRVWRIGEPFEMVARHFLPRARKYRRWQAQILRATHVTKSLRSEYDHLMLGLHDSMKRDLDYQQDAQQMTMAFAPGSAWVCFSDQASHAVMSGQYMLEQTMHLPPQCQYDPGASPLAILARLSGRALV